MDGVMVEVTSTGAEGSLLGDARILRSRAGLQRAFLKLLEKKSFEQITIRDITETAKVGYRTFFRHYPGKEALLDQVVADACAGLVALTLPIYQAENSRAACIVLCSSVHEHRSLWSALLTGGAAGSVREELLRRSREISAALPVADSWLPRELGTTLAVSAIIDILTWWLRQSEPLSAVEIAEIVDRVAIAPGETAANSITGQPLR